MDEYHPCLRGCMYAVYYLLAICKFTYHCVFFCFGSLFVSRLMVIPHLATTRILMTGRTDHCMQNYRFNLVLYALITAAGSAVFVVRTIVSELKEGV